MKDEPRQDPGPRARILPLALFAAANALVLAKYASRVMRGSWAVAALYFLFVMVAALLLPGMLERMGKRDWVFSCLALFIAILLVFAMKQVDPSLIRVDRFSAVTAFNEKLLRGQFPYAARTHLGNPVSGFPGLFLVLLPFHLAGDAGYFEVFAFLLFAFLCFHRNISYAKKSVLLLLLGTAPLFLWETTTRSELFGNVTLLAVYLFWLEKKGAAKSLLFLLAAGFLSGVLLSTRGILVIPLILFMVRYLAALGLQRALLFVLAGMAATALVFLPFYFLDPAAFAANNPFTLQAGYIPKELLCGILAFSVLLGVFMKTWDECLWCAGLSLFATIAVVMVLKIAEVGFSEAIFNSRFDVSYFLVSMPFLLLSVFPQDGLSCPAGVADIPGVTAARAP